MDKRDLGDLFRERLALLLGRYDGNHAAFAKTLGLDRSALSQLLADGSTRLPRAETLQRLAETHHVSLDWLLGLSQSERQSTEIAPTLEIEEIDRSADDTRLARWHREAIGYKIRYVPSTIPDLLRTPEVIVYLYGARGGPQPQTLIREADSRLAYSRRPETDMEVCMPRQTLESLAHGEGLWAELPLAERRGQLDQMATLVDELYPTFRLFLFDGRRAYSAPYTVFGPLRAALYVGDMYLVVNAVEHIRALARHFDALIRLSSVNPHEVSGFIRRLRDEAN
jgi:transcriptional regulator with XRE-family HTH domain